MAPGAYHLVFEEFVLKPHRKNYQLFDENSAYVFNSYYESVGDKVIRTNRGNLSRPTVSWIYEYRDYVTKALKEFLKEAEISKELCGIIEIGCHHEKQHQELLLTDIKFILGNNPLFPKYNDEFKENPIQDFKQEWIGVSEGVYKVGHQSNDFCYDNEMGAHKVYLNDFKISNKLITNAEFIEFIEDGGYEQVLLWHAEGWDWINTNNIKAPLYWHHTQSNWHQYTLNGLEEINPEAPLSHISYYEAFAFAQWKGLRLPTEFEWEVAQDKFNWGDRWEWTESAYSPYPNYKKPEGALGEYNGKFMVSQKVLRGASVATSPQHSRHTYRNFFHPQLRWQFTGLRLAK